MYHNNRVAVVTGSNRGIGYAIAEKLAEQFDGTVIMTARNVAKGKAALNKILEKKDFHLMNLQFHQLDITDPQSIEKLRQFLVSRYHGLDLLINNAGIHYSLNSRVPFGEQAEKTLATNFKGTLQVCKVLFPILRPYARVVNLASDIVELRHFRQEWQQRFLMPDMTEEQLCSYLDEFISDAKAGLQQKKGWPRSAYSVSQVGLLFITQLLAKNMQKDPRQGILINSCCPGTCRTEMSGMFVDRSPEDGAESVLYAALLPDDDTKTTGKFLMDKKTIPWPK